MNESSSAQAANSESDRQLVDKITYLASLASKSEVIDPLLETLRMVTAHWEAGSPLNANDRTNLLDLEQKLKKYLLNNDPVRSFTPESLDARINSSATVHISSLFNVVWASLATALIVFLVAPSAIPLQSRALLTIPFFFLVLHIGIAWFYLSALKNFKPEFRQAFVYICVGVLFFSVSYSHYILIELLGLDRFTAFQYGGLTGLITLSFIWIYAGLRRYARILTLKTKATSLPLVLGISALVTIAAIVAPHGGHPDEFFFDLSLASLWLLVLFIGLCLIIARGLAKVLTPAYAKPMHWLVIYCILGIIGALGSSTVLPILGELRGNLLNIMSAVLGIGPQMLLLYTGYVFKKETSR